MICTLQAVGLVKQQKVIINFDTSSVTARALMPASTTLVGSCVTWTFKFNAFRYQILRLQVVLRCKIFLLQNKKLLSDGSKLGPSCKDTYE